MHDDEINAILERMNNAGVPPAGVRRALDLLGQAEELSAALGEAIGPHASRKVQEELAGAMTRMLTER